MLPTHEHPFLRSERDMACFRNTAHGQHSEQILRRSVDSSHIHLVAHDLAVFALGFGCGMTAIILTVSFWFQSESSDAAGERGQRWYGHLMRPR
jgi:hypothetical protein